MNHLQLNLVSWVIKAKNEVIIVLMKLSTYVKPNWENKYYSRRDAWREISNKTNFLYRILTG